MRQLSENAEAIQHVVLALEAQLRKMDLLIMAEPTGYPREEMTCANILIMGAVSHLKEVS